MHTVTDRKGGGCLNEPPPNGKNSHPAALDNELPQTHLLHLWLRNVVILLSPSVEENRYVVICVQWYNLPPNKEQND